MWQLVFARTLNASDDKASLLPQADREILINNDAWE